MTPWVLLAVPIGLLAAIPVLRVHGHALDTARDRWLDVLAGCAVALLLVREPALGLISVAVWLHWRTPRHLPAVCTWAGVVGTWLLVQAAPAAALEVIPRVWRVVAVAQVAFAVWLRVRGGEATGGLPQRSLFAAWLALVLPFTAPWEWPVYAAGLALTWSWLALLAAGIGLVVRVPALAPWCALLAAVVVLAAWWRPTRVRLVDPLRRTGTLDGIRARWRTWTTVPRLRPWRAWLLGSGPGADLAHDAPALDVARAFVATGHRVVWPFHCAPLELAYTYGLLAVAALVALAWQLIPRLAVGDPWSAAVVAGAVLACGTIPCRVVPVGLVWLVALAVVSAR